jgi:hypothetical protein
MPSFAIENQCVLRSLSGFRLSFAHHSIISIYLKTAGQSKSFQGKFSEIIF